MCLMYRTKRRTPGKGAFKCLNRWSYGERLAKEAFLSTPTRGSKKDSDRTITPAAEAVCVSAQLALPGSPQAKQLCHLHNQLSLGQSYHRQKKVLCLCSRVTSAVSDSATLQTVACQASLSGRGLLQEEYWSILANTGCHTLIEHYISCCPSCQLP